MKKISLVAALVFLGITGAAVKAQQAPPSDFVSGNIACFDYYKFGSVQADLQPQLAQTVPGAALTFTGKIVNDNNYPLVDGKLFVKIFKREESTFTQDDGNPVVDQFVIEEGITLPAKGSKEASFEWKVPSNAMAGEYYAAYFFNTSGRYNLMGLAFTDDIVGNQASFTVVSDATPQVVLLQKNPTTLNGQDHKFAHFPLHFGADEVVTVKTTLYNPSDQTKTVPLQWNQYAWDDQNEDNRRNTQTELVTLAPNETKEVSYQAKPQKDAVVYVVAISQDGDSKSFLNVRYVRDNVPETRINFPSLTQFPLKAGEENTLFACAHSTSEQQSAVEGNTLFLNLKDRDGEIIHQYRYEGRITSAMGGFGEKFLPEKNYDFVTLEAQLFREGSEMEKVSITYDCKVIDPNMCLTETSPDSKNFFSDKLALVIAAGIVLLAAIILFVFLRRRPRTIMYLLAFTLGMGFLGAPGVEAKTVTYYGQALGAGSYGDGGPFCGPCGAWVAYVGHVTYGLSAYVSGTSTLINENATVPAGTAIDFRPEFLSTYLDWFSQGGSIDSPYGIWTSSLASVTGDNFGWAHQNPSVSFNHSGSTAGLSCNGSGSTCTVTSAGIIQTTADYAATPWKSSFCGWGGPDCLRMTGSTPAQVITYPINVSAAINQAPNTPTISGPTTGSVSTSYSFTVQASDPNGDTLRYGMDWDNNGTVDQWLPGSGYVASNVSQATSRSWVAAGTYTFRALAQDNQGANSGWRTHTITINPVVPPAPTVNLTINGSNGPLNVSLGTALNLSWSSTGATSCTAWGTGWGSGSPVATSGSGATTATATDTYVLQCTNGSTTATDSVQVNLSNSLKVCQNSCSSGIQRGNTSSTQSFTLARGGTQNLVTCFNPSSSCNDASGNVTGTWGEGGGSVVSLSGTNPKTVSGDNAGTENISATYSGQTANMSVTVTCVPTVSCSNAPGRENYCQNENFNIDNGCGTMISCTGTKTCNYNWKEVAP